MRIADLSRMTVWTEVSEADVGHIRPGSAGVLHHPGLAGRRTVSPRRWNGTLRQVLPAPPTVQGTYSGRRPEARHRPARWWLYIALVRRGQRGRRTDATDERAGVLRGGGSQGRAGGTAGGAYLAGTRDEAKPLHRPGCRPMVKCSCAKLRIGVRDRLLGEVLEGVKEGEADRHRHPARAGFAEAAVVDGGSTSDLRH